MVVVGGRLLEDGDRRPVTVGWWLEDGGTQWRHIDVSRAVAIGARRLAADPAPQAIQ